MLQLLEFPGFGKVFTAAMQLMMAPVRLLGNLVNKAVNRAEGPSRPEQPVLEEALTGWIDQLRKESARYAQIHPLWAYIAKGFHSMGLAEQIREQFAQDLRTFQSSLSDEVDRTARAIYEELEKRPVLLNSLRSGKLALEVAAVTGTVVTLGIHSPGSTSPWCRWLRR